MNYTDNTCLPPVSDPYETVSREDLRRVAQPQISWLWHGFLAHGNMTLLTSNLRPLTSSP
jgi:hypothetical protein